MKVAIVQDDLMRRGGAEQVVLSLLKAYPTAVLYTLCYRPKLTYPEFQNFKIKTSIFNPLARNEKWMKWLFFPIGVFCMKNLRVRGYDLVIVANTYCAKYAWISPSSKIFMYTHTPFRLAWNPQSYQEYNQSSGLKRKLFELVINILKKVDRSAAEKGDYFITITEETAERVRRAYLINDVAVINPPVKCHNFYVAANASDYYLLVSRLEYYKKVDIAISAFNNLGYRLIVVGNGSKADDLKKLAQKNIEFKSGLTKEEIAHLYSHCKAFIFPQYEDYGITPLEANASGRPVIAYGQGGVLETMIPYDGLTNNFTSIFFKDQTEESLIGAIKLFETVNPDPHFIRKHAEKFDEPIFVQKIKDYVQNKLKLDQGLSQL